MKRRAGLRRTGFSRRPRHRMSPAEEALWARLGAVPAGTTFQSQMPVRRLTADFGSYDARIVIEIDGAARAASDAHARTVAFEAAGYLVLRFAESEVLADIDRVIEEIGQAQKVWSG